MTHQINTKIEDYIQKQENKGKKILRYLIVINLILFSSILVLSMLNGIFENMIGLIIMIILCFFIYNGGNIAKWIYIVINTLNIISLFVALIYGQVISNTPVFLDALTIIMLCVSIITSIVLMFSSSVKEFMYKQRD